MSSHFTCFYQAQHEKKSFYAGKSREELINVGNLNLFMFHILKPFMQSADEMLKGTASGPDQRTPSMNIKLLVKVNMGTL